jgi:hypothetical protein
MNFVLKEYFPNKLTLFVNSSYLPIHPPYIARGANIEYEVMRAKEVKNSPVLCYPKN